MARRTLLVLLVSKVLIARATTAARWLPIVLAGFGADPSGAFRAGKGDQKLADGDIVELGLQCDLWCNTSMHFKVTLFCLDIAFFYIWSPCFFNIKKSIKWLILWLLITAKIFFIWVTQFFFWLTDNLVVYLPHTPRTPATKATTISC